MPDLFDATDEFDKLLLEVARKGGTTKQQGDHYVRLLRDAEQAHQPFARPELEACLVAGAQHRVKGHIKARCIVPASTRGGRKTVDVNTVRSTRRDGKWHSLPLGQFTIPELTDLVDRDTRARNRATDRLEPERRLLAEVKGRTEATVEEALAAVGTTLPEVLARAS